MNLVRAQSGRVQIAHHLNTVAHVTVDQIPRGNSGIGVLPAVSRHGNRLSQQGDHRAGGIHHLDQPHDLGCGVPRNIRDVVFDRVQAGDIGPDIGDRLQT